MIPEDPYNPLREAFHTVADGLMGWEDPVEPPVHVSNGTRGSGASYRPSDVPTLEKAVALWALALRVRHGS